MKPSAVHLLAVLGLLAASPFARADALDDARAALSKGDFTTAKTQLDTYLADPNTASRPDDARVLRALARLGSAVENDIPSALRARLGANVANIDFGSTDLALRFPRPFYYFNAPAFTVSGSSYRYGPAINLYENGGAQPSISFENNGTSDYVLTLVVSQPEKTQPDFDSTLYLDGQPLGYANAINEYPFQVFVPPLFELSPDIPRPFDQDLSVPSRFLAAGTPANSFTVTLPPKSNFTFGLVVSTGDISLTPTEKLPSTIKVQNGKAGAITPPRLATGANLSGLFTVAGQLETSVLAPAIADLEAVSPEVNLVLHPSETGALVDTVVAYPDVQLLLTELKLAQGVRRLSSSYNFSLPLTPANLAAEPRQLLLKNQALLTPKAPTRALAQDRLMARELFVAASEHYSTASAAGLWDRPAPESGVYLFSLISGPEAGIIGGVAEEIFFALTQLMSETLPLADLGLGDNTEFPVGAGITLAPIFGSPALDPRRLVPANTDAGILRGGSRSLLTSGLVPGLGTEAWESLLAERGVLDLESPAITAPAKIQRQPAALTSVAEGDPATLLVVAECYPAPTYKWYRRSGKTEQLVGEGSPSFFIEAASREDAGNYFVRVSNSIARPPRLPIETTVTSTTAVLQVTYAPEIVSGPADVTRYQGSSVTLDVSVVGVPKPNSFQWFRGDIAVTPARASSRYTFTASAARAGDYHVVIKNAVGEVTSQTATVEVQTPPVFTTQPQRQTVAVGATVTFTAAASGNPTPQIKWRKNGRDIGVTGPTLTLNEVTAAEAGIYTAVAFNTVQTSATTSKTVSTSSTRARLVVDPKLVLVDPSNSGGSGVQPN